MLKCGNNNYNGWRSQVPGKGNHTHTHTQTEKRKHTHKICMRLCTSICASFHCITLGNLALFLLCSVKSTEFTIFIFLLFSFTHLRFALEFPVMKTPCNSSTFLLSQSFPRLEFSHPPCQVPFILQVFLQRNTRTN